MKLGLMFSVIFSVVSFAAVADAQHTRVIFGSEVGIWRDADGGYTVYPSSRVGTIVVAAGRTVRLRFGHPTVTGRVTSVTVDTSDPSVMYQVPCEREVVPAAGKIPAGTALPSITDLVLDGFDNRMQTDPAWKGTCRLLVVRLTDGSDRRVKLRFQ